MRKCMNKPVAWMETYKGEPNNLDWDKSNLNYGSEFHDVIPLYTHPVKELTDEEIEIEWFKVFKPETGIGKNLTNGVYEFALAILKKAQEKCTK